ncbi:ribonuclease E inhibitor RraB [Azomonas macrocytogenes]|uniref:Regulator of ribonuclease activity B domain-containing protein n=1 Tax=Azomonas macrocytogenes TaxID=69962 RepID=A0A839T269_AZOMA|nr:ribonuclease E inhibitor RraB [Azomonas macrocytogenes]MBB3103641.1 hypothetical protein [Azomonas macrocytogenes]
MGSISYEDVSGTVLRQMKESGFDFARIHAIDFYAIFPDEDRARQVASRFRGESINTQVFPRDDGGWNLQVSKIMYATYDGIDGFEQNLEGLVEPLGGVLDGWGVTQEIEEL